MLVALPCHVLLCGEWFKLTNMPTYRYFCHALFSSKSESVYGTCYVYMDSIISSVLGY